MPKNEFRKPPAIAQKASWTQPSQEETATETNTYTSTSQQVQHRNRGAKAFEKTHERITLWIDKSLKQQFEALADEEGTSKTKLLNEAITDLLTKYGKSVEMPT